MSDVVPDVGRHAVLVDAGYLYASVGQLVLGRTSRREFRVAAEPLIGALLARADRTTPGGLLRMYWYDAARDRVATVEQRQIATLPNVKVRLGNLNSAGQQKGVDAQLRQDLELLARNRAISDVVLVAGDEDMVSAVEAAQAYGVRVHVWGVEPPYGVNQAERLVWEADTVDQLDAEFCRPYVKVEPAAAEAVVGPEPREERPAVPTPAEVFAARKLAAQPPKPAAAASVAPAPPDRPGPERPEMEQIGARIAGRWLLTRGRENVADLLPGPVLPTVIDKELLVEAEEEISRSLRPYEEARRALRDGFWAKLHQEFGIQPSAVPPHPTADHQPTAASHPTPPAPAPAAPAHPGPAASAYSGAAVQAHAGAPGQGQPRPAGPAHPGAAGHSGAPAHGQPRAAGLAYPGPAGHAGAPGHSGPAGAPQPGPAVHAPPAPGQDHSDAAGLPHPSPAVRAQSAPGQDHSGPAGLPHPGPAVHAQSAPGQDHSGPDGLPHSGPAVHAQPAPGQDHAGPAGAAHSGPDTQADSAGPAHSAPAVEADSASGQNRSGPAHSGVAAQAHPVSGQDHSRPAGAGSGADTQADSVSGEDQSRPAGTIRPVDGSPAQSDATSTAAHS